MSPALALDTDKDLIQCRIDRWGRSNGLIFRDLSSIAQTKDGYIWLGTGDGLVRFDGVMFRYFPEAKGGYTTTALTATSDGSLWYGTNAMGFGRFEHGSFVRKDPGGPDWTLTCGITEARNGDIWVSAEGKYLAYVVHNGQTRPILRFQKDLPSDCWVVKGMVEGDDGRMWAAVPDEGLVLLNPDGTHRIYRMTKPGTIAYPASISRDRNGAIWLAASELGLWRFSKGHFTRYTSRDGVPSNVVQCVYCDREGSVWIGTRNGISRYINGRFTSFSVSDVYGDHGVSAITEDQAGNLWLAVGHELIRFENTKLTPVIAQTNGGIDSIFQVCPCALGGMWMATSDGLRRWTHAGVSNNVVTLDTANRLVTSVHETPDGTVAAVSNWDKVYTRHGNDWKVAPGIKSARLLFDDGKEMLALSDVPEIRRVLDGSLYSHVDLTPLGHIHCAYGMHGIVWLGGVNGLMKIAGGRATLYTAGLPSQHNVLSITPGTVAGRAGASSLPGASDDGLWVGTDSGIALFANNRFRLLTASDGMLEHACVEVLTDGAGNLWAGGGFGLMRVPIDGVMRRIAGQGPPAAPTYFDFEDGVRSYPGAVQWSAARTVDGDVCFQGAEAVTVVNPYALAINRVPPIVHLDRIIANGHTLPTSGSQVIPPGRRALDIYYTGLSFKAPDKVQFRYQLVGFDKAWIYAGTRRAAYYTNLPFGTYTFKVSACNEDGIWSPRGDSVMLTMAPYFYETWWFHALVAAFSLYLLWYAYRQRIHHLRSRNIALEGKVAERTSELLARNNDLQRMQAELVAQNAELNETRIQAEAANRAKSGFLANMSHELRTPLNAVLGFSNVMRNDRNLSASQLKTLDIINRSGEHLLGLINDVLDVARIEAGRTVIEPSAFDLGGLIRDILDMMRIKADQKDLELILDQSSEFPRFVRSDSAKLRQVIINLVNNAIKFTDRGSVTVRLMQEPSHNSDAGRVILTLEVEDTGPGIDPSELNRIFEPFVQVGQQESRKGTGLGLTITRQYVELMGGRIGVESEVGKGSLFRIVLPIELADYADVATLGFDRGNVVGLAPGQPRYRILVVEDQLDNALLLERLLADVGFDVRLAENGAVGVEIFKEWHPQFIWMDRRMPVMDGIEATKAIRALDGGADVKIAALTASAFTDQRQQTLAAGMDDFVRKPYRSQEIYDCMARLLGVRYRYEGAVEVAPPIGVLTPKTLSGISAELRGDLMKALIGLDRAQMAYVIGRISEEDEAVGVILNDFANRLAFTPILKALQAVDHVPA